MKKTIFITFFLVVVISVYSDENIVIERSSFVLKLNVDENRYWEWAVPKSPYVFNDNYIQFYSGEIIFVEADVIDDIIISLAVVKEIRDQSKTIIIEFNQITDNDNSKIHKFMMLKIINPFNKNLEYKANVYLALYNKWWINTSIIPVRAKLTSYESWPDIIGAVVLYDFILK